MGRTWNDAGNAEVLRNAICTVNDNNIARVASETGHTSISVTPFQLNVPLDDQDYEVIPAHHDTGGAVDTNCAYNVSNNQPVDRIQNGAPDLGAWNTGSEQNDCIFDSMVIRKVFWTIQ